MIIHALINGQPVEIEIPNAQLIQPLARGALGTLDTCLYLGGCSTQTLWRLEQTGEIHKTVYGTYLVESLNDHLAKERKKAEARNGKTLPKTSPTNRKA